MARGTSTHLLEKLETGNYPAWRFRVTVTLKTRHQKRATSRRRSEAAVGWKRYGSSEHISTGTLFRAFLPNRETSQCARTPGFGSEEGMLTRQLDVNTAYLHGQLQETVDMEPPTGPLNSDGKMCLLNKALYGLKQSGRTWHLTVDDILKNQRCRRPESDPEESWAETDTESLRRRRADDDFITVF